jgi:leader peptidase (prepilin peptidase)/N-methyltransferase
MDRAGLRKSGILTPAVMAEVTLVVLIGGAAVTVSVLSIAGRTGVLGACLAVIVIAIAVVDRRYYIIPDWLNAAGFVTALICAAVQDPDAMLTAAGWAVIRGGALAFMFLAIRLIYTCYRGRQGLGLGDVKLAAVAGAWLEWLTIPIAIEIAALAALLTYMLNQFLTGRPLSATNRLPFGLFLAPTVWICWVLQNTLLLPN